VALPKKRSQEKVVQDPETVLKQSVAVMRLIPSALPLSAEAGGIVSALKGVEAFLGLVSSGAFLNALRSFHDEAQEILATLVEELPTRLSQVLGTGVEVKGVRPDYILDGGLHIHLNEPSHMLLVGGTQLPLAPWKDTAQAIGRLLTDLRSLAFDADEFLKDLFEAYLHVVTEAGKSLGTVVPVERVMQTLALAHQSRAWRLDPTSRNYRSYGRDQLRMQLYRLVTFRPQQTFKGHRLNLTAGSNTSNALFMYIPSLGRCAYVGLVSWTPDSDAAVKT
jgi:hypothetical protein